MLPTIYKIIIGVLSAYVMISFFAFINVHHCMKATENLYNAQPRAKKFSNKLKWPAKIIAFITLQKFRHY